MSTTQESPTHHPPEQYLSALDKANHVRLARAELKRKIGSGEVSVASVLLDPPVEARTWQAVELLSAQRGWGLRTGRRYRSKASKFLRSLYVPESKPVGQLTSRQRDQIIAMLGRPK